MVHEALERLGIPVAYIPIVVFILTTLIGAVTWGLYLQIHLQEVSDKTSVVEGRIIELNTRLEKLDQSGSRELGIVMERQNNVISRVQRLEEGQSAIKQQTDNNNQVLNRIYEMLTNEKRGR